MNSFRDEQSADPFPVSAPLTEDAGPAPIPPRGPQTTLPAGWRLLPLRLRGARVYRVMPPGGGAAYWHAEMVLSGVLQERRCASELYALWWIAALKEPPPGRATVGMVELHAPLRGAGFRHG